MKKLLIALILLFTFGLYMKPNKAVSQESDTKHLSEVSPDSVDWKSKPDDYWKGALTSQQYEVTRQGGTEAPFTGQYYHYDKEGNYICSNCGQILFSSKDKFDSGSGWPSFSDVVNKGAVVLIEDTAHGMTRTEVRCARCGAHLGHVFDDGPGPTGKRFCINSAALGHVQAEVVNKKTP